MWFWFAVIALLCWSGSDLFSKIGCRDSNDKTSYLKMVFAVGVVMGLHAAWEIFVGGVEVTLGVFLTYLPVSLLYISSMAIGYLGLRYIELSISSPICNSSGAIVAVLTLCTAGIGEDLPPVALVAVALVCVGVIGLGFTVPMRTRSCGGPARTPPTATTPRAGSPSRSPSSTVCSTRSAPLPTASSSRSWTRTAPTAPMS